jgi:hypothetical protein
MDNASNNDTFVRELATKLTKENNLEWDFKNFRF